MKYKIKESGSVFNLNPLSGCGSWLRVGKDITVLRFRISMPEKRFLKTKFLNRSEFEKKTVYTVKELTNKCVILRLLKISLSLLNSRQICTCNDYIE